MSVVIGVGSADATIEEHPVQTHSRVVMRWPGRSWQFWGWWGRGCCARAGPAAAATASAPAALPAADTPVPTCCSRKPPETEWLCPHQEQKTGVRIPSLTSICRIRLSWCQYLGKAAALPAKPLHQTRLWIFRRISSEVGFWSKRRV
jgi:hypothetical protein